MRLDDVCHIQYFPGSVDSVFVFFVFWVSVHFTHICSVASESVYRIWNTANANVPQLYTWLMGVLISSFLYSIRRRTQRQRLFSKKKKCFIIKVLSNMRNIEFVYFTEKNHNTNRWTHNLNVPNSSSYHGICRRRNLRRQFVRNQHANLNVTIVPYESWNTTKTFRFN